MARTSAARNQPLVTDRQAKGVVSVLASFFSLIVTFPIAFDPSGLGYPDALRVLCAVGVLVGLVTFAVGVVLAWGGAPPIACA